MIDETILHYKILEKLGEGGMGVVYKAQDTKLNRIVALKFLPEKVMQDEEAKKRFLQEAQSVAALNHNYICTIHGIEESDSSLFMVMEYVEGGTLNSKIPFSKINDALKTAVEIGEALQEAHSKGIVHRDIKADNIMLTANGQVKVMDFGLAKLKGALKITKTLSTVGTLGYMSPEQIQGGEVDHRSDIFSFGVLLFEMLTGSPPFLGQHEAAIIYSVVNEEPQDVVTFVPELSPLVVNLIQRCLEKDPEDRYQTMQDAVSELRRSMKKSSGSMRKSTITRRVDLSQTNTIPSAERIVKETNKKSFLNRKNTIGLTGILVILVIILFLIQPWKGSVEINSDMKIRALELPVSEIGYPGLSGDGNWAAFPGKDAGGTWHIYFTNTGGYEPRVIATDSFLVFINSVDISFDGSRIIYDGFTEFSGKDFKPSLYITSSLGGGTKVLIQNAILPRWQPDGKRIFYISADWLTDKTGLKIRSITPEGTDDRLEFIDSLSIKGRISLSVSPDNKSIVWERSFPEGYQEIMIRNLVSADERQITHNKKNIDEVCWASNNQIIFSSNINGNTNLWMIPADGGKQVQITKGLGPDLGIKISTDLSKLLYYQTSFYNDFWIGNLKKGTTKQITFDDKAKFFPLVSPDDKYIAFHMSDGDVLSFKSSIYISNIDGSNKRKIASDPNKSLFIARAGWSPDGSLISYCENLTLDSVQQYKSYVIDSRQGISKFVANGYPQFWLNDDNLLLNDNNKKRMQIASISKGTVSNFFEDSTFAFPLPGNKFVVYRERHYNADEGYWIVPIDGSFKRIGPKKKIELKEYKNKGYKYIAFSGSREFALYINSEHKLLRLWYVNGKEESILGSYPNFDLVNNAIFFSKSDLFSYTVPHSKGKLVMIDNLFK